jgi:hypothetical protein
VEALPMTWFPDMARESMVAAGDHVRAVGWLGAKQPYTQGPVPPDFVARLREFARLSGVSAEVLHFGYFRGFHTCEFCGRNRNSYNFGVPAGDVLFVAPAMIGHYVERHGYAPPAEFIAAVAASPLPGTPEYHAACAAFRELHGRRLEESARPLRMEPNSRA